MNRCQVSETVASRRDEEFLQLLVRSQKSIYLYIRSMVFRREDAEDLLQDVTVVLWRKSAEFEPGTSFVAWACAIARNVVLNFHRRSKRHGPYLSPELLERIASRPPSGLEECNRLEDALEHCLRRLSPRDRKYVQMRYFDRNSTGRSIARLLGKSEAFVSRTLGRIRMALQNCIEKTLDEYEAGNVMVRRRGES